LTHIYLLKEQSRIAIQTHTIGVSFPPSMYLGNMEVVAGNIDRALRHYMIAVSSGETDSLSAIQSLYSNGHASKEDYTTSLRSYQEYLGEIKSRQRDEAAATDEEYRYY